jgi:hypothetical protein
MPLLLGPRLSVCLSVCDVESATEPLCQIVIKFGAWVFMKIVWSQRSCHEYRCNGFHNLFKGLHKISSSFYRVFLLIRISPCSKVITRLSVALNRGSKSHIFCRGVNYIGSLCLYCAFVRNILCKMSICNAVECMWVLWKLAQRKPLFSYRRQGNCIADRAIKPRDTKRL